MKLFKTFILFTFCILTTAILAQPQGPPPPKFKITFSNNNPQTGDIIEIIFKADIPAGIHMYSSYNKCDVGPLKFEVKFKQNDGFCTQGAPFSLGDKHIIDDIFNCEVGEFFNKAEIHQKIKILGNELKIEANIEGQWCSETACFNFGGNITPLKVSALLKASGTPTLCDDKSIKPIETFVVDTVPKEIIVIDTTQTDTGKNCTNCSYKVTDASDNAKCQVKTFNGQSSETEKESYWGLFIIAFLSGLAGLLTPCVFPMIPMTISFFMKDEKSRRRSIINGLFFGLSIVLIYVILGVIVSAIFGEKAGNFLATHWLPNILFFIVFLVFAFSFFGAFEIMLPSWLVNKVDRQADKGGYYGIFFMALTLAIVSFSCTGPIVSSVLVGSANGQFERPILAMLGFGLAFALPFSLFAIFPSMLNRLPKSGGWLNSVKVVFGFLELALAFKFLSIVDLTRHWHILDREIYLSLWIVIFGLMGVYLLGKIKFSHDSDLKFLKVPRLLFAVATLSFVMYLIPGLWGAPLKGLAGYLPPMSSQDFDINRSIREANGLVGNICKKPSYSESLHVPLGLNGYFDYDEAIACGKNLKKPVFLDFTGHGCVNCRKMEEKVWSDPKVYKILSEEYVIASLYVDDHDVKLKEGEQFTGRYSGANVTMLGDKNSEIQLCYFKGLSQPLYCLLDGNENLLHLPVDTKVYKNYFDKEEFYKFLEAGLAEFKKRNKK